MAEIAEDAEKRNSVDASTIGAGRLKMDQTEHESQLVKAFIRREKHDRMLGFLAHPKKRQKATDALYHLRDLNEKCTVQIKPNYQYPDQISQLLREKGAPKTCWVVSTNPDLDAKELDLDFVLSEIIGRSHGTLLSCIPGVLGYFEGETPNDRFILQRPK
ncbi:MAG: hypothetical protein JKX70_10020 [Phycisphaerales bacterium]|nr:hypothetical protein [Phycisphaerales bacterium]